MADDGAAQSTTEIWPLVKFQFKVTVGSTLLHCQEVTGLSSETQVIEYRYGDSSPYSTVKMPGIKKYGNVTLKKGMFKSDVDMWKLYNAIKMNTIARVVTVISLLDESSAEVMTWNLANSFPCKMTVTDMKADANEPAIETMELAHEGLTIVTPEAKPA